MHGNLVGGDDSWRARCRIKVYITRCSGHNGSYDGQTRVYATMRTCMCASRRVCQALIVLSIRVALRLACVQVYAIIRVYSVIHTVVRAIDLCIGVWVYVQY